MTICSLYATKLLCAAEGGVIVSNHQDLLSRALALRQYDEMEALNPLAGNYKMTDVHGGSWPGTIREAQKLSQSSVGNRGLLSQPSSGEEYRAPRQLSRGRTHVYFRFVVRLPYLKGKDDVLSHLMARLESRGVQCRRPIFRPLHQYLELPEFPISDEAYHTALSLPLYPSLTD